jgi:shikimate dehydrogenase
MKLIDPNTKVIALVGNPVRHSLSPKIHNYLMGKYSKNAVYLAFELKQEKIKEAFIGAKELGFTGLNITMPYKEEVYGLVNEKDRASEIIKSVNAVKFDEVTGLSTGFNTDTDGFIKSLEDKGFNWAGSNCLVIGAGGAAKSTIYGMLIKKIKKIYVYNRTKDKVRDIIINFKDIGSDKIRMLGSLDDIGSTIGEISLLVNCTPIGMDVGSYKKLMPVPAEWDLKDKLVFDMVYKPAETMLLKKAKEDGAVPITGIEMLINQAVFSFNVWFDIMPDINDIKELFKIVYNNKLIN